MTPPFFLHVGLHKTGTTFLQKAVFPAWEGITYLRSPRPFELARELADKPVLLSDERMSGSLFRWIERGTTMRAERSRYWQNLSTWFPGAKIIIGIRRHSSMVLSLYKQYLHQGGTLPLGKFYDLCGSGGILDKEDLMYVSMFTELAHLFGSQPFVYTQEGLRDDPESVFQSLAECMGGSAPKLVKGGHTRDRNRGVTETPAKFLLLLNRFSQSWINPSGRMPLNNYLLTRLRLTPRDVCQNLLTPLFKKPMTLGGDLANRINEYYSKDWEKALSSWVQKR